MTDDTLAHYGVKGMRWGHRKTQSENYSDQQVKRDVQVYGKRGARRINTALNDGDSISVARGVEKSRRDKVLTTNKYTRQTGKVVGAIGSGAVGLIAARGLARAAQTPAGRNITDKLLGSEFGNLVRVSLDNPVATAAITAGAAKVGHMLAGDIAVNTRMRLHGYDPNRR